MRYLIGQLLGAGSMLASVALLAGVEWALGVGGAAVLGFSAWAEYLAARAREAAAAQGGEG